MENEFQSLVNALREARCQAMYSLMQRRVTKGLLTRRPFEWRRAYKEVADLKIQMTVIEEAYNEMKEWGTHAEKHNKTMAETIEEDNAIMLNLQKKVEHHREKYLKLVILSIDVIDDTPQSMKEAEDMMDIFKPLNEICDFIKL